MNKSIPPSPGSFASSESESHSVSDENFSNNSTPIPPGSNSGILGSKQQKIVKKLKDEEKRPPWKPASVSPVIKSDASALLKARLLDASRRVIRAAKLNTIGVQTEPERVILMREAYCETNPVEYCDAEVLTDGNLIARNPGNLILTHSIAQMTDFTENNDISTQTAMPRSSVSFRQYLYNNKNEIESTSLDEATSNNIENVQWESTRSDELNIGNSEIIDKNMKPLKINSDSSDLKDSIQKNIHHTPDLISAVDDLVNTSKSSFLSVPTLSSWQDMDFSNDEEEYPKLPRRTHSEGSKPWSNFKDLVLGERLQNMRLSPIQRRPRPTFNNQKHVTWSDSQIIAVSALLDEASALIEMVDRVSILLGPDVKLNKISEPENFQMSPPKWNPILKKSCNLLEEKFNQLSLAASEFENCSSEYELKDDNDV